MKGLLGRLLGRKDSAPAANLRASMVIPELVLREDATLPIVDWDALDAHAPHTDEPKVIDEFWTSVAYAWLEKLKRSLGGGYTIVESDRFLMLGSLQARPAKVMLEYVEKTRRRIGMLLEGIAQETEIGKACILVLRDKDTYYQYASNYYPDEGEFALSGGMFLQYGYGHFVFTEADMSQMEPTIAHELTHCLLQHLYIPAWLNEGIAVNTEHRLCPPGRPMDTPEELHQMYMKFWNPVTIQEFWSGKSWNRPGESNKLSYDLATHFVQLASDDRDAFRAFVNSAHRDDGGAAAATKCLGYPVEHLAQAILGEGDWAPKPETWKTGTERGQFPDGQLLV